MTFDYERFDKWVDDEQIPQTVKRIVDSVMCELGFVEPFYNGNEEVIELSNRGGWTYAYGKGFCLSYRTSSMLDGPDADPKYIIKFIKGLGFCIENSYGDNGLDAATNWHDTYWHYDFLYKPSVVMREEFEDYSDEEYND